MDRAQHPWLGLLLARASEKAGSWLVNELSALSSERVAQVVAGAGRRFGDLVVSLGAEERQLLAERSVQSPEGFRLCDVARALVLLQASELSAPESQPELIERLFKTGDNKEREALLKTLVMLPNPERFLGTAVDACRSHVQSVFEAIACENEYPARYFPDASFNQLVLKAFFTGVQVERIRGLKGRLSPELSRMAKDYASERRAAGRPVPPDLDLVTLD